MTRFEALKAAEQQLVAASAKVSQSLTTVGQAAEAAQIRVRIARGYIDLARELRA